MEYNYIKNRDLVLFAFGRWDAALGNNFTEMARELSKHNRVLYVNRAPDRAAAWKKKRSVNVKYALRKINDRLWVEDTGIVAESINWLPTGWLYDRLNRMNAKRLAGRISRAINELRFTNIIIINDNDFMRGRYLRQYIPCASYIFYLRDYLLGVGYFMRHGPRLESATLQLADLVVTNSAYLAKYAAAFNKASFDIGQGCDFTSYLQPVSAVPDDMRFYVKPVIGYAGYISSWRIDMDIVQHIAQKFPQCAVVMVGPLDKHLDLTALKHLLNLHFIGIRKPALLPAYISCFDVCINPQQMNNITAGNYPRKIDEYLAIGKPVVATRTEAMQMFEDYCCLCTTKTGFVQCIERMLANPEQYISAHEVERRKSFALTHTWAASIGKLGNAFHAVTGGQ